jgi:hypothetical protein
LVRDSFGRIGNHTSGKIPLWVIGLFNNT